MDSRTVTKSQRSETWHKRYKEIKEEFPSVAKVDWDTALDFDPTLLSSLLADLLKAEGRRTRPGKRPPLDRQLAETELAKVTSSDYSEYPFGVAFKALVHGRSIRNIAHKTGLDRTQVHRLLGGRSGEAPLLPSFETMAQIAKSFNRDPSYFLEYRTAHILFALDNFFQENPETATVWFKKLKTAGKIKVK